MDYSMVRRRIMDTKKLFVILMVIIIGLLFYSGAVSWQ